MLRLFFSYVFFFFAGILKSDRVTFTRVYGFTSFHFCFAGKRINTWTMWNVAPDENLILDGCFFLLRFDEIIFSLDADADVDTPSYLSTITI